MAFFDGPASVKAANDDGEFKLAARLWNADLRLEVGQDAYKEAYGVRVRDGRIIEFTPVEVSNRAASHDVCICAPQNSWRELLSPVPKPFYQDLMAAVSRQDFKIQGDMVSFYPYYRAINRLFELMRNLNP